jgi:tRNA dimethylallyltransferase
VKTKKILILGVTASGKGRLAFELAKSLDGEVLSIDSMKVYRRMDIGTAKPPKEAREQIPYRLIDVVEPSESFSVGRFITLANTAIEDIQAQGKPVIAVGGTALYIKTMLYGLFDGPEADPRIREQLKAQAKAEGLQKLYNQMKELDPQTAGKVSPNDVKRIIRALEVYKLTGKPISSFQTQWNQRTTDDWMVIGLRGEKTEESKRINARVKKMIEQGLVEEVESLLREAKPLSDQARCAIGYAEIIGYLSGKTALVDAIELIKKNTRKLAKAQRTWFKTFKGVHWLDISATDSPNQILAQAEVVIEGNRG